MSRSTPSTGNPQVNLRMDPDLLKRLKVRARTEGRTVSNLAKFAIEQYLEKHSG